MPSLFLALTAALLLPLPLPAFQAENEAYVHRTGTAWTIGTSHVEQTITLQDGRLLLHSFRNKQSNREYRDGGPDPSETRFTVNGQQVAAPSWHWTFVSDKTRHLAHGEVQLDIALRGGPIELTKHWLAYPQSGIIRSWSTIKNTSQQSVSLQDLFFLNTRLLGAHLNQLQLSYLTGGGAFNGSQLLKTEPLTSSYLHTFDSEVGIQKGNYSAYLPLLLLRDSAAHDNLAVGWDYMGHWSLQVAAQQDPLSISLAVAGYHNQLSPGSSIDTPKAFLAALSGDLDAVGNQILDWQYRFFWDATNADYFAKTRWAVDWPSPWIGNGGTPSADNWGRRLALDLRYVDLLRESGGDILWDDAGWYDRWGTWNGPDWQLATSYLRKHDMRWVLWFPTFLATSESAVAQQHPPWVIPEQLAFEQSIPETASWQKQLLDASVEKWHDFQWRYDIAPAASADDTKLLAADTNFRGLLDQFKRSHPASAIDACDGGGRWISYDLARLADSGEYTDGGVGPYSGYYTSLLVPPDKLHNVSDFDHTYYIPSTDRVHLGLDPTWYRDPGDGPDVAAIRQDWDLYHYFVSQGVAGRWSHIFRPVVNNDDPIWYLQRMDPTGSRGVILTRHAKLGPEYFLISTPVKNNSADRYEGGPTQMPTVLTTGVVVPDTGIYSDPTDAGFGYYGVPGEVYGPLNFRYRSPAGETSYVTAITKHGLVRPVTNRFFGMAFQAGAKPLTISELGQYDTGKNRGTYSLKLIRASDKAVLASATLDMSHSPIDSLGFRYAKLSAPVTLKAGPGQPITVFPRGLQPSTVYDVRADRSAIRLRQSGSELMTNGLRLPTVPPGELIFLNLPSHPGAGTDKTPPEAPAAATKRLGVNLGTQGIEISWSPAHDNNWISFYEILKNGSLVARSAKGTFYFDHSPGARSNLSARYEVRTVDGDGNRSPLTVAQLTAGGERETYEPLGDFAPSQDTGAWRYEESADGRTYTPLTWTNSGYEGQWAGSGLGRIGRIWMQPAAGTDLSRTFVSPVSAPVSLSGQLRKDPSADPVSSVFVRILANGRQLWPASGWTAVPPFAHPVTYRLHDVSIRKGEIIRFVVKRNAENRPSPIIWDPLIQIQKGGA